jgi:dipeptidyl aminopeptidase/acylaminoacyl peptidase
MGLVASFGLALASGLTYSGLVMAEAPPAAAFGNLPALDSVTLSPNGQLVAWVSNALDAPLLEVYDLAKGARWKQLSIPEGIKVRSLSWADDEVLLIHGSLTKTQVTSDGNATYEWFRLIALEVASGKSTVLLHKGGDLSYVTGSQLLATQTGTPKKVIMSSWNFSAVNYKQQLGSRLTGGRKDDGWSYSLYEVDTLDGEGKVIHVGTPFTDQWVLDAKGEPVARSEWKAQTRTYTIHLRRGQAWQEIFRLETGESPWLIGVSADGAALLMRAALDRPHAALWGIPIDGSAPRVIIGTENSDVLGIVRDPHTRQVIGATLGGVASEVQYLDETAGKRAKALLKTFGGKHASVIGRSADGTRVLVSVGSHAAPVVYYLIDYKKGTADIIGDEYPGLANVQLGEVRALSYAARDGYQIPAYLTLPPAVQPAKLPLVVLPHGGPESRDTANFDFIAQFLATRGYAVLQPQFRGSTGFGEAHRLAGYRQWGGRMQDDVTDGVKAMIEQGIADPKRICIAGISYGGYAALAGAAFTPDLYACAVSVNGVSDLPSMIGYARRTSGGESDALAYWRDHIGPAESPEVMAKSPVRAVDRIRAPILLMHGVNDTIVPVAQSQEMSRVLREGQREHEFIALPSEDHWLSGTATRIRVLTEMEGFFGKHLASKAAAGN